MSGKLITILTPTYNRAYCLKNLYNSLLKQNSRDFQWLIIDDGSKDNTDEVISSFIAENSLEVIYIKKENGGKHTAINYAMNHIDTKYTFIVDSDDIVTPDAIEMIAKTDHEYGNREDICGYSFLRSYPDGKINGKLFEKDYLVDTYTNVRIFGNDTHADKAEVFFTECLKKYPFPEFANERFLGEDIVWVDMAKKYNMVHINTPIYVGDYQTDGLTTNRRKNNIKSCHGCYERSKMFLSVKLPFKIKIKNVVQLIIYGKFCGYKFKRIYKDYKTFYTLLLYLPSLILYKKWDKARV